ncbi:unnamed protein product [Schistosoma mattheei]|uniref:Mediator of RNA polymerase II transcription subunit 22 n=1 Tax=Schistosoma mattheei TaxID=31246 RepID=A0AA85B1J8_9TREM|nr:unnamed protein product [Schistosoma mattheei]
MQSNQRSTSSNQPNFPRKRNTHVQGLKSRLRSNINSILSNYEMILSRSKIDPNEVTKGLGPYAQCAQDTFEFSVRAANIVHACENITRLVSEIKQFLILGDFRWLARVNSLNEEKLILRKLDLDRVSNRLRDKLVAELHNLEQETSPDYPIITFPKNYSTVKKNTS